MDKIWYEYYAPILHNVFRKSLYPVSTVSTEFGD